MNKLKTFPECYKLDFGEVYLNPVAAARVLQRKTEFILSCNSSFEKKNLTVESSKEVYDNLGVEEHRLYDANVPWGMDCCGVLRTLPFREVRDYLSKLIADRVLQDTGLFLDFGSGNGFNAKFLSERFPGAEIYCIDISKSRLQHAHQWIGNKDNIAYRQMNGACLQFPDNIFDFVYSCHAFEQMESVIHDAVKEFIRVMKYRAVLIEPIWENADLTQRLYIEKKGYVKSLLSEIKKHSNVQIVENFVTGLQDPLNPSSVIVVEKNKSEQP